MSTEVKDYLENCGSTAHRALMTAKLFGDRGEIDFWTVVAHYLTHPSTTKADVSNSNSSVGSAELINLGDTSSEKSGASEDMLLISPGLLKATSPSVATQLSTSPLETSYDYLCDSVTYKVSF